MYTSTKQHISTSSSSLDENQKYSIPIYILIISVHILLCEWQTHKKLVEFLYGMQQIHIWYKGIRSNLLHKKKTWPQWPPWSAHLFGYLYHGCSSHSWKWQEVKSKYVSNKVHTYLVGWFRWMGVRSVMCPKRFPETFSYKHLRIYLAKKKQIEVK